jgi:hypothetical protein
MTKETIKSKNTKTIKEMMVVGTGGFTGSASAAGPVAGFDPLLGKIQRRKNLKSFKQYVNR